MEEENTVLREDLKDLREENKDLKGSIAKLAWLIQNKIEEEERTSESFNEKEDLIEDLRDNGENALIREEKVIVRGAHKSLEPLISLEETSENPSLH